jgi:hypothetical protein
MPPGRRLSAVEEFVARTGTPVVLGATVHGPLDTDALAHAVRRLCDRHPILTHRITRDGSRHRFTPAPDQPPPHLRLTTPDERFDAPFAPGDPLLRATLAPQPDGTHRFAMAVHHAVSDGVAAQSLASLLWQTYTARVTGGPEPTRPFAPEPHPATDDLLAHRHPPVKVAAWLAGQAVTMALHRAARLPSRPASPEQGAYLHTTELTTDQAHGLYRTARRHHTTSSALLCAIVLLAARTQLDRPRRLGLGVTVGLRACTTPPIPTHHVVTATSFVPVTIPVGDDDTAASLGPLIDRRFAAARATAHAERQAVALRYLLHAPTPIPYTMMLTNMATHRLRLTLPPDLRLTGAFGYAPPPGPLPAVFVTRVDRTLALHLATPKAWFDAEQAARLARALDDELTASLLRSVG